MAVTIPQIRRIMFNDEQVGMGFNSESGLAVGTALEGFTVQPDTDAPGQEVSADITIINTHEQLQDKLGMSFEAHGRYGLFSGSAKAKFSEQSDYNSTSTFLVARCVVQNAFKRGKNFQVREPAQALLNALRFPEFKTAFGDSFVRGLQTGGEFYAVVRITSVSISTQTDLGAQAQLALTGLIATADFKAELTKANKQESTRSEFSAMMFQRAGVGTEISPTIEIDDVKTRFKTFPTIVAANPVAYEIEVATYDTLPLPVPTPEEQEAFLFALLDAREKKLHYIQTRNDLEFARQHPLFFDDLPSADILSNAGTVYTQLLNAVMDHAIKLSRGQISPPRVFDPAALTPPLLEPAPISLQRRILPTPPTIRVPNLVGLDVSDVNGARQCVANSTVDECLAAIAGGQLAVDAARVNREILNFCQLEQDGSLRIVIEPAGVDNPDFQGARTVVAQMPPSGALLTADLTVVLNFANS